MTKEEMQQAAIKCQLEYLVGLVEKLPKQTHTAEQLPEFITLELAAKLKGGAAYNTYKSRYYLQPCGGTKSVRVGGKKCWKKEDVFDWLTVDDTGLAAYLERYGVKIRKP